MVNKAKEFFRYAIVPISLLIIMLLVIPVSKILNLPSEEELILKTRNFYLEYGYLVVFIAAIIEGALFINWYLPGSVVIVLGVVFAKEASLNVVLVVAFITLGFLLTTILNYFLGSFGWYRLFMKLGLRAPVDKARQKMEKYGLPVIFGTYFHPNMGALTATSAGILKLPFVKFFLYSLIALIIWNTLWGIAVYFSGTVILKTLSNWTIIFGLTIWIIYLMVRFGRGKNKPTVIIP